MTGAAHPAATTPRAHRIHKGTPAFWRTSIAFFMSGFATFSQLYSVQPLLPVFSQEFHIDAGMSSLALSAAAMVLAFAMPFASGVADRHGRKNVMVASLLMVAALSLFTALAPSWPWLVAVRGLEGLALSGIPAVSMVYLAEEMEPSALGLSMGLYIGGNAIGGMCGRLIVGFLTDAVSWRFAIGALAGIGLVNALLFWWLLPRPAHSPKHLPEANRLARLLLHQFRDPGLPWLFAIGGLIMGAFVTLYNNTGYRLTAPPYNFSQTGISLIFIIYPIGSLSSAWIGALAGRLGRRKVLWLMIVVMAAGLAVTALPSVVAIIGGLALVTFGYFGAHSIASSWVSRRAQRGKAQATSLYMFFFYVGASLISTGAGYAFSALGWPGVLLVGGVALLAAFAISVRLFFLKPLPIPETPVEPATEF